jgi:hypothetical protein
MNITQLKESLPFIIQAKLVPNIIGKHGIGKSSIVAQYAKDNGYSFHPFFLGQMNEPGDLLGLPEFNRDKNGKATSISFVHPDKLPKKPRSILFFDELNRASKELLQAIFQLALEGTYHDYTLPEDSAIIMAMNPATDDYSVLDFADKAFADRFVHINLDPTHDEFHSYMNSKFKNSPMSSFLKQQSKLLEEGDLQSVSLDFVKPSRRSWDRLQTLELTGMPENLFKEAGMGIVGMAAILAYNSWKSTQIKILSGAEILDSYDKVKKDFLKHFSDENTQRSDIVSTICSNVSDEFRKRMVDSKLTEKSAANFTKFLLDAPVENAYAVLIPFSTEIEFSTNVILRKTLLSNVELINKIVEAKNAKKAYMEEKAKIDKTTLIDDIPF